MNLRFGTDGVRGRAFDELSERDVEDLGAAAAAVFDAPCFFVARDTRESGPALVQALCLGLSADGADVVDLGVAPTPAVAGTIVKEVSSWTGGNAPYPEEHAAELLWRIGEPARAAIEAAIASNPKYVSVLNRALAPGR